MLKYALAGIIALVATAPAFAAEYYIVRGPDKTCKVVQTKPADKTSIIVGDKVYTTEDEATKQVAIVCRDDNKKM